MTHDIKTAPNTITLTAEEIKEIANAIGLEVSSGSVEDWLPVNCTVTLHQHNDFVEIKDEDNTVLGAWQTLLTFDDAPEQGVCPIGKKQISSLNQEIDTIITDLITASISTSNGEGDFEQHVQPLMVALKTKINQHAKEACDDLINFMAKQSVSLDMDDEGDIEWTSAGKLMKDGESVFKQAGLDIGEL